MNVREWKYFKDNGKHKLRNAFFQARVKVSGSRKHGEKCNSPEAMGVHVLNRIHRGMREI